MYRKRMSEALEEARSYRDPVNEDKGFSSQQIKMAYGVLNDPRYKQGNYSGAFKAIEKIAKGLASHPDVANALKRANEELEEEVEIVYTDKKTRKVVSKKFKNDSEARKFIKQFDGAAGQINFKPSSMLNKEDLEEETITEYKKMTVTFRDMATMSKASTDLAKYGFTIDAKGLVMKVDGKGADLNAIGTDIQNFYGATVVAENLEERFTKKEFDRNEDENEHGLNAKKVVDMFGTGAEKMKIDAINARHNMRGSISREDQRARDEIVNKYYPRLK